jgi:AcrR family transcriptional regulator
MPKPRADASPMIGLGCMRLSTLAERDDERAVAVFGAAACAGPVWELGESLVFRLGPLDLPNVVKYPTAVMSTKTGSDPGASTGSSERRRREQLETRQRILDAARELFVAHGYEATSMRSIAQRIEYTPTAIYHHFESKEDLLSELCAQDFRALAAAFQRIGRVEDPVERLERIGAAYVAFAVENPMHYRLMFMTMRPAPRERDDLIKRGDPGEDAYAFLVETVREARDQGRFRPEYEDVNELAQMFWGSCHGIVALWIAKGRDPWVEFKDPKETSARIRAAVFRGMLR